MKKLITLFALVLILTSTTPVLAVTATNSTGAKTTTVCIDLTGNLSIADKGTKVSEVLKLQSFLYPQYLTEPPTGYFGVLTDAAVKKFQSDYGLNPVAGYVGPLTRAKIKELTCGGNSQTSTGTKTGGTVASRPSTSGSSYNSNGGWWLNPTPTPTTGPGSTGATDPVKTTNTGNHITPTSTTTPPVDCERYAGVIPNESRKVSVVQRSFPKVVYSSAYGALSQDAQKDLALMQGDLGYQLTFGEKGPGGWNTISIPSGTAYSYKFKTTEYNFPVYYRLALSDRPATAGGVVVTSISLCPGDFTSPQVMAQTSGHDEYNTGNTVGDQKFRNCVTYGRPIGSGGGIEFGVGGNTQYICALEPNKTYYLNVSAGFAGGGDKGHTTPHIGTFDGTTPGADMVADFTMSPFGHLQAVGNIGNNLWSTDIIKNRTAFYTEARRVQSAFSAASQQRVAACRAAIAANTGPRTGRECNGLTMPTSPYFFQ